MKKIFYMIGLLLIAVTACVKEGGGDPGQNTDVVVSLIGEQVGSTQHLQILPYVEERTFEVKVRSAANVSKDVAVFLREDAQTLDQINDQREKDGLAPYERFPRGGYEFNLDNLVIPAGTQESEGRILKYFPNAFDANKEYLLALKVVESSEYNIDETHNVILISNAEIINSRVYFNTADPEDLVAPITVYPFADVRNLSFDIGLDIETLPKEDIQVTIEQDANALTQINAQRVADGLTPYLAFPEDAFSFDKLEFTIRAGESISDQGTLTYLPYSFDPLQDYLLPLTITSAAGYSLDPVRKTLLITAHKHSGASTLITATEMIAQEWVVAASTFHDATGNTRPPSAVIDGDSDTWWESRYGNLNPPTHNSQFPNPTGNTYPHWLKIDMKDTKFIQKISLQKRQNAAVDNFSHFDLRGSIDGETWFDLKMNTTFDNNNLQPQEHVLNRNFRYLEITMRDPGGTQNTIFNSAKLAEVRFYELNVN